MLKVPIGRIRSIGMQQNADLEYIDGFLPIKIVVTDEGGDAALEIMKPVLVVTPVTSLPSVPVTFIIQNLHLDRLSLTLFRNLKSFWKDSLVVPNSPTQVSLSQIGLTQVSTI